MHTALPLSDRKQASCVLFLPLKVVLPFLPSFSSHLALGLLPGSSSLRDRQLEIRLTVIPSGMLINDGSLGPTYPG